MFELQKNNYPGSLEGPSLPVQNGRLNYCQVQFTKTYPAGITIPLS